MTFVFIFFAIANRQPEIYPWLPPGRPTVSLVQVDFTAKSRAYDIPIARSRPASRVLLRPGGAIPSTASPDLSPGRQGAVPPC